LPLKVFPVKPVQAVIVVGLTHRQVRKELLSD